MLAFSSVSSLGQFGWMPSRFCRFGWRTIAAPLQRKWTKTLNGSASSSSESVCPLEPACISNGPLIRRPLLFSLIFGSIRKLHTSHSALYSLHNRPNGASKKFQRFKTKMVIYKGKIDCQINWWVPLRHWEWLQKFAIYLYIDALWVRLHRFVEEKLKRDRKRESSACCTWRGCLVLSSL